MTTTGLDLQGTFRAVIEALDEVDVAHAFIGGLPVVAWGRGRATTDIDLIVTVSNAWPRLTAALRRRGIVQRRQIGPAEPTDALPDAAVFFTTTSTPVRVDVFIGKADFERAVLETARQAEVLGATVRVAAPEASIIYQLLARRPRDVESIFIARAAAASPLDWQFLDAWAKTWAVTDRLAPFRQRFHPE
ncbi:MAG: hypothetical protein ABI629_19510 [bacterium]